MGARSDRADLLNASLNNTAYRSVDFDLDTGDAPVDQALLCISVDAEGRAVGSMESGVVHDARAQKLRGALHCP